MVRFRIRTNWTNSVSRTHEFRAGRLGRRVDARPAEVGVLGSRSAAAGGDPAVAHRARGGLVRGLSGGAGRSVNPFCSCRSVIRFDNPPSKGGRGNYRTNHIYRIIERSTAVGDHDGVGLHRPLRLLPAGATVAGRDSHPLRNGALSRRTGRPIIGPVNPPTPPLTDLTLAVAPAAPVHRSQPPPRRRNRIRRRSAATTPRIRSGTRGCRRDT